MEYVFVVKRPAVAHLFQEQGLFRVDREQLEAALHEGFFVERPHAEKDSSFKQIIPYVVIRRGADVFLFKRLKGGGEARLHNLYSVGVGGHINPSEVESAEKGYGFITEGGRRELLEEVGYLGDAPLEPLGLLNDDTNEVGSVHLGVVLLLDLPLGADLISTEEKVLEGSFVPMKKVHEMVADCTFESWSEIVLAAPWVKALWSE
ncbi:hypothetical protein KKF84_03435 [Myxococcota bacterium]|nr:hypothetical protein [Myxococcota bacterium]MBU1534344.1 hypothetical protein [Myxococcota bacterium]